MTIIAIMYRFLFYSLYCLLWLWNIIEDVPKYLFWLKVRGFFRFSWRIKGISLLCDTKSWLPNPQCRTCLIRLVFCRKSRILYNKETFSSTDWYRPGSYCIFGIGNFVATCCLFIREKLKITIIYCNSAGTEL